MVKYRVTGLKISDEKPIIISDIKAGIGSQLAASGQIMSTALRSMEDLCFDPMDKRSDLHVIGAEKVQYLFEESDDLGRFPTKKQLTAILPFRLTSRAGSMIQPRTTVAVSGRTQVAGLVREVHFSEKVRKHAHLRFFIYDVDSHSKELPGTRHQLDGRFDVDGGNCFLFTKADIVVGEVFEISVMNNGKNGISPYEFAAVIVDTLSPPSLWQSVKKLP